MAAAANHPIPSLIPRQRTRETRCNPPHHRLRKRDSLQKLNSHEQKYESAIMGGSNLEVFKVRYLHKFPHRFPYPRNAFSREDHELI